MDESDIIDRSLGCRKLGMIVRKPVRAVSVLSSPVRCNSVAMARQAIDSSAVRVGKVFKNRIQAGCRRYHRVPPPER
jgi:hypothetical protein